MSDPIQLHGFTALPRDTKVLLNGQKNIHAPTPISINQIQVPSTPLATATHDYAKMSLSPPTYAHSMRVYYYGLAIARQQFPSWAFSEETYFLTCMLHDIGTTTENLRKTLMSFEFYGGLLALNLLQSEGYGGGKEQAEAVAEVGSTPCPGYMDKLSLLNAYFRSLVGDHQTSRYWRDGEDYDIRATDPACYHLRYEYLSRCGKQHKASRRR